MLHIHHPAVWNDRDATEIYQREADLEPGSLDGEVRDVCLATFDDLDILGAGMAPEVPVDETADGRLRKDGAEADGDVAEAYLDRVEMIGRCKLGRERGYDNEESCVQHSAEDEEKKHFFLKEDGNRGEETWTMLHLDGLVGDGDFVLPLPAVVEISHQGDVPFLGRHRAVADDVATGLGQEEQDDEEHNAGEDV